VPAARVDPHLQGSRVVGDAIAHELREVCCDAEAG
jgi:hypothetical protein